MQKKLLHWSKFCILRASRRNRSPALPGTWLLQEIGKGRIAVSLLFDPLHLLPHFGFPHSSHTRSNSTPSCHYRANQEIFLDSSSMMGVQTDRNCCIASRKVPLPSNSSIRCSSLSPYPRMRADSTLQIQMTGALGLETRT